MLRVEVLIWWGGWCIHAFLCIKCIIGIGFLFFKAFLRVSVGLIYTHLADSTTLWGPPIVVYMEHDQAYGTWVLASTGMERLHIHYDTSQAPTVKKHIWSIGWLIDRTNCCREIRTWTLQKFLDRMPLTDLDTVLQYGKLSTVVGVEYNTKYRNQFSCMPLLP
jgi:hypothetical protein